MRKIFILFLSFLAFVSCQRSQNSLRQRSYQNNIINLSALKANMEFLASDELQGRETGTIGERIASKFLASELQKYGVQPFFKE